MSDGMLVVNFAALQQAGADIQAGISGLQSTLSDLESAAKPLVETWAGDAKEAYQARQATWRQASQDLTRILADIKRALDESAQSYLQTENSNKAMFQ